MLLGVQTYTITTIINNFSLCILIATEYRRINTILYSTHQTNIPVCLYIFYTAINMLYHHYHLGQSV